VIRLCKFINQTHLQKRVKYPFNIAVIQFIYRYAVPCLAETGFNRHLNQHHCLNHGRHQIPRHSQSLRHCQNEILRRRQCQAQHGAVGRYWLTASHVSTMYVTRHVRRSSTVVLTEQRYADQATTGLTAACRRCVTRRVRHSSTVVNEAVICVNATCMCCAGMNGRAIRRLHSNKHSAGKLQL